MWLLVPEPQAGLFASQGGSLSRNEDNDTRIRCMKSRSESIATSCGRLPTMRELLGWAAGKPPLAQGAGVRSPLLPEVPGRGAW